MIAGAHRLGRYQLIRRLAVGGMAEIYLARVPGVGIEGLEKLVVVKRILPQHALEPELLRMFLDEARLSATLTHPHVTAVYDVGTSGDAPFFVMEHVHGANLRQILKAGAGRLPLEHVIGIVAGAAAGLHYAHEKLGPGGEPLGIVHRDVSPSNVLVSYDGAVKVSDFGIAKWAFQRTQTQEGALKGKFAYMSPEQCQGLSIDRRSDVFALGTLLYELSSGVAPFRDGTDFEILNQIVGGTPAPPSWPAGERPYPEGLARIVMRALARDPTQRHPTAQALQVDLEAFARAERLEVSTVALGAYMQALFADELAAWREAQRAGKTLADHLAEEPRPSTEAATVRTATDAFAAARPAPRGRGRRVRVVVTAAIVIAGGVAGGVVARGKRAAQETRPTPSLEVRSTAPTEGHIVESHPAPAPPPVVARPPSKRPARVRAASPAPTPPAATGTAESRLKEWDPDSPVPP